MSASGHNHQLRRGRRPRGGGLSLVAQVCAECGGYGSVLSPTGERDEVCPRCGGIGVRQ